MDSVNVGTLLIQNPTINFNIGSYIMKIFLFNQILTCDNLSAYRKFRIFALLKNTSYYNFLNPYNLC